MSVSCPDCCDRDVLVLAVRPPLLLLRLRDWERCWRLLPISRSGWPCQSLSSSNTASKEVWPSARPSSNHTRSDNERTPHTRTPTKHSTRPRNTQGPSVVEEKPDSAHLQTTSVSICTLSQNGLSQNGYGFSARTSLFEISGSPSKLMHHHVLFHELVSLLHWLISQSLANIVASSVKFNERCMQIMKESHPRLQKVLFAGTDWRSSVIKQLERSPSYTITEMLVNPFQMDHFMDIDESTPIITGNKGQASSSSKPVIVVKSAKIMFK